MSNRTCIGIALCAALAVSLATPAHAAGEILLTHAKALAGNVTPGDPPGYPIVLTRPGSYQLASNLFTAANKITIQVTSDNVTIDLNGFTLHGSGVAFHGIVGSVDNVTIRGGTITGFKFDGINAQGNKWIVENMRVVNNGRDGVLLAQAFATVTGNMVIENVASGIVCGTRCLVEGNNSSQNGAHGISIGGGMVLGNVLVGNGGFGIQGFTVTGYGNNTLSLNNGESGTQISGVVALQPNLCSPACP
jgi:hypothetical protein